MGDSNDFTFCQVGPEIDDDNLESPKSIPDIGKVTVNDDCSTGTSVKNHDSSPRKDNLLEGSPSLQKGNVGADDESLKELNINARKPIVRGKVPFEKGHSQMDWLKITRTHPDLAGLKGQSNRRLISMDEVKQHKTEGSVWTVLKGCVYNISPYMKFHPGGVDMIMKAAGKDCTSLFNKYHAWVNAEFLLEKCLVGILDDSR